MKITDFIQNRRLYYVLMLAVGFFGQIQYRFFGITWITGVAVCLWLFAFLDLTCRFRDRKHLILTGVVFCLGYYIKYSGYLGYTLGEFILFAVTGIVVYGVFLLASCAAVHWNHLVSTLVFPVLWMMVYGVATALKVPSVVRLDMFFVDMDAFIQCEQWIGSFGLTFAVLLIVSLFRYAVANRNLLSFILGTVLYLSLILAGMMNLYLNVDYTETVKIAYTTGPYVGDFIHYTSLSYNEYVDSIVNSVNKASDEGAEMLVFNEEAFEIDDTKESEFLNLCCAEAEENSLPMIVGLDVNDTDGSNEGKSENKIVCIDGNGVIQGSYCKSHLIPMVESEYKEGDGVIPNHTIEIGGKTVKIAYLICYDSNFPGFINKIDDDTDILFLPSWDWSQVSEMHSEITCAIAAENQVCVLKPTYDGISVAVNPDGSVFSSSSTSDTGFEKIHIVEMPVKNSEGTIMSMPQHLPYVYAIISTEVFSIIICIILLIGSLHSGARKSKRNRLFCMLILTNIAGLVSDGVSWISDGCTRLVSVSYINTELSLLITFILLPEFTAYLIEYIRERRKISSFPLYTSCIYSAVSIAVIIIFSLEGKVFSLENGYFCEGPLYSSYIFLNVASMVVGFGIIMHFRKNLNYRERVSTYLYMAFPVCSALINCFIDEFSYAYAAITISLTVVYIMIQSERVVSLEKESAISTHNAMHDELTNLNNRRAYEQSLQQLSEMDGIAGVVYCDLNGLKYENDHFGHAAGDRRLMRFSDMLTAVFRREDVYRIGGDEFVVLLFNMNVDAFESRVKQLDEKLSASEDPLASIGSSCGECSELMSLIKTAESVMYKNKEEYHRLHAEVLRKED